MLPQYVQDAAKAGRCRVGNLDNPKRRPTDSPKLWSIEDATVFGDTAYRIQEIDITTGNAKGKPVMLYT